MPLNPQSKALLKHLGASVRRERMARAITQERLAEMADLNLRTIQKIEAGSLNVLITTMARIRESLGCAWKVLLPER